MDRRYSSSSSSTATETAKKAAVGNALNGSIRFRNGLSSDSTGLSPNHRKSFPSTSDVGSSFNSTMQVITLATPLSFSSFTFDTSPSARISCQSRPRSITSSNLCSWTVPFEFHSKVSRGQKRQTPTRTNLMFSNFSFDRNELDERTIGASWNFYGLTGTLLKWTLSFMSISSSLDSPRFFLANNN